VSLGRIFNIQRYSLQDGPGLRTTVFFKGCPLDCAWCHNPESQAPERVSVYMENRCIHCGLCKEAGPVGHDPEAWGDEVAELCPTGARQMLGRDVEVQDLVDEVMRDRIFFDQSGGGVTFSGGEPLLQKPFVVEALAALKARGVHTALDTCGVAKEEDLLEAASLANLVLYDLKHMDDAAHRRWTGEGNATILSNLEALGRVHDNIWIRVPLIPGVNDGVENLEATAAFVQRIPGIRRVELLPYHATGAPKFQRLGRTYTLEGLEPPTRSRMTELEGIFKAHGIPTGGTHE
jgi:pyruvate formate lyase activating enzyme